MIQPRSLSIQEPRPVATEWVCADHGPILPPGEVECPWCDEDQRGADE